MFRMCESPSISPPSESQADQTDTKFDFVATKDTIYSIVESTTSDLSTGQSQDQNTLTSNPTLFSFGCPKKEPSTATSISTSDFNNFSNNIDSSFKFNFGSSTSSASSTTCSVQSTSQSSSSSGLHNPTTVFKKKSVRRFTSNSTPQTTINSTLDSVASKLSGLDMSRRGQNEGQFQFQGFSSLNNAQENMMSSTSTNESDWRKTRKTHTDRMEYLLESGFLSDVTFAVGPEKVEIKGHRAILAIGSPVFQAILTGKLYVEGQPIPIPDMSPLEFKVLLKYLYLGDNGISLGTFLPLYHAAKKFSVDELTQKCVDELIGSLTKDNVCHIYEQALTYNEVKLGNKAQEFIFKNARYVVESVGFLKLSLVNLMKIISRDELRVIDEVQLVKALYNWGKYECQNQNMEVTGDNIRLILKPIITQIRIPQMDASSFSIHVAPLEILTEKELISSLLYFNVSKCTRSSSNMTINGFSSKPRSYFKPTGPTHKFHIRPEEFTLKRNECESVEHPEIWSSINFLVDKEIWIKSIGLFLYNYQDYTCAIKYCGEISNGQNYLKTRTNNSSSSQYICKLKIEEKGTSQEFVEKIFKGSCDIQDIPFETPIHIQPNKNYTISLFTVGPATLGIKKLDLTFGPTFKVPTNVRNGPVTFTFLNAAQNPGILKKIASMDFFIE